MIKLVALLVLSQVKMLEEGAQTGKPAGAINCTGAGITCTGPTTSGGVATVNVPGGAASGYQTVRDENDPLTQRTVLNFTGTGVQCADNGAGARTDCTINSGGGNVVSTSVTFAADGSGAPDTVVTGQTWVTSTSTIVCNWFNPGTVSNITDEVYKAAGLSPAVASTRVVGTGFTVAASSTNGATGQFFIHCTGV